VRDEIEQYKKAGVQPFGVNPATVDSHKKYSDKMKFNFPLLSDPDRTAAGSYGALKPDGQGIQRSVVLVGKDGRVRFAAQGAPGAGESLKSLQL
jgi:thioredoxin-dependent peroxiredoxin